MHRANPLPYPIASVGILGGGTAGYFAALALKKRFPRLTVTVVESSAIPIIGVGEATTTLMPPFLHKQLGIDIAELYRDVRPTWKLGIKFDWGQPGDYFFTYPFGDAAPVDAYVHDGDIRAQSLASLLMAANRSPILRDGTGEVRSLLPELKFAYHLHNAPFVAFLAKVATRNGIEHVDAIVDGVSTRDGCVQSLRTRDGRDLRFDLYIDASGFRSRLIGEALGSRFRSYASSLFCDTAIVAEVPHANGMMQPYTLAETMNHGWCWRIPVEGVDHRGYVHASAFVSEEDAIAEMRAKNPDMGRPRTIRFQCGRYDDFWKGNVVALGNSYGFVEPLESTALHMVIIELAYVAAIVDPDATDTVAPEEVNRRVADHWDYLRWFLALHYKFNRKLDTEFWRACRADVDVSGLMPAIARFQEEGPWDSAVQLDGLIGDPAFGSHGLLIMLLGQQVECPPPSPRMPASAWARRVASQRADVERALPQAEALRLLQDRPDLLSAVTESASSWCANDAEIIRGLDATGNARLPHLR